MNAIASETVLVAFVVFSRVGACLLVMPGFSSPRIPVQVRLFIALALALALTPLLLDELTPLVHEGDPVGLLRIMASELFIGALIGLLGRLFFVALETIAMGIAMSIGLSSNLGAPVNEDEPLPALSTLLTLAATVLLFLTDQHLVIVRAITTSYTTLPVGGGFAAQPALVQLANAAGQAFVLALRIGSPFLIFSIVVNFGIGLTNRLVPAVQIFFLASPFLLVGGLLVLTLTIRPLLQLFTAAFSRFMATG